MDLIQSIPKSNQSILQKEAGLTALKTSLQSDFSLFANWLFHHYHGREMELRPFHWALFNVLTRVYHGDIKRLIINIPPRHGKSEILILFMTYIFANNPKAYNMFISYSDELAKKANGAAQSYIKSDAFQRYWPIKFVAAKKGWGYWMTLDGGESFAASTGGQVTGFGSGIKGSKGAHGGCLIIDDPNKPKDTEHEITRNAINRAFVHTISNRRNDNDTPIVIIMQRLHEEDLAGFLLDGGDGHLWHHLKIPVYTDSGETIWPTTFNQDAANKLERSKPYVFSGQYMQEPAPIEGGIWKRDWFDIITKSDMPQGITFEMYVDGAYSKKTSSDPSGIMIAGYHHPGKKIYVLHNEKRHLEMPQLIKRIISLYNTYRCKLVLAEPRASGKSIIQLLKEQSVSAKEIKSRWVITSKLEKAHDCAPYIEGGMVKLVRGLWNEDFLSEVGMFPNAKHDEDIDNLSYCIERKLLTQKLVFY